MSQASYALHALHEFVLFARAPLRAVCRAVRPVMPLIRVAIVEDERPMRESLAQLFIDSPEFELVAALETGAQAIRLIDTEALDVLLVDLGLPDMDGRDIIRHCSQRQPDVDVLVVTVFGGDEQVFGSLAAGATGFLRKDEMPMAMVDCVRTLRAGGSPVSPSIARRLLGFFHAQPDARARHDVRAQPAPPDRRAEDLAMPSPPGENAALSGREVEILALVGKGLSVADIGGLLHISTYTVGTHVKNIYRKLAVHSRTEAVYEARHLGLIRD